MTSLPRRFAAVAGLALAAVAATAPAASAGLLVASASDCEAQSVSQPFLPWADPASYTLAPGGDLESTPAGWTLSGGAGVSAGNEPWNVHGAGDSAALALPAGSSATTGAMCVGIEHPTVRFFAQSSYGTLLSGLRVEALYEDAAGTVRSSTMGYVGAAGAWGPTAPLPIGVNLLTLLPGEHTPVAFRFTPEGSASWRIDDVYVDPYSRG